LGVAELKQAFNEVAEPAFSAQKAYLSYETKDTIQFQRLKFSGTSQDGTQFEVASDQVRPGGDVLSAARETAQRLLARKPP
jgi:hypothetical protein